MGAALLAAVVRAHDSTELVAEREQDVALQEQGRNIGGGCSTGYGLEFVGGEVDNFFAQRCSQCVEHCCEEESILEKGSDSWMYYFAGRHEHECTCHKYQDVKLKTHRSNLFYHPAMRSNRCP